MIKITSLSPPHVRFLITTYNMYSILRRLPSLVRQSNPSVKFRGFCASASPFQVRRDLEARLSELEDEAERGTFSRRRFDVFSLQSLSLFLSMIMTVILLTIDPLCEVIS